MQLARRWRLGGRLGGGGFGAVHEAEGEAGEVVVAKLIPKHPGAERELSFDRLAGAKNVVPVLDSGETDTHFVIVMPLASTSLEAHLTASGGQLAESEVRAVLVDVATALIDLAERQVVHRDIKPANVLYLDDAWCLADFGIARYAEATTATNTWKLMGSTPYVAPERWRMERATSASDVYAVGVTAFELLSGAPPFQGPAVDDYAQQHLHQAPPPLPSANPLLASLVIECLLKSPEARPTPANLLARLQSMAPPLSAGAARLQELNRQLAEQRAAEFARDAANQTDQQRRATLAADAAILLSGVADNLRVSIVANAPLATHQPHRVGWQIRLGPATLTFTPAVLTNPAAWNGRGPAFDVVAHASLNLHIPRDRNGYEGRSHSLWYCDALEADEYHWYEIAFMVMPLIPQRGVQDPFALDPGREAGSAVGPGIGERQVAWPFTALEGSGQDEFFDRWLGWFATAAQGNLRHPSSVPEGPIGSWRQR